MLLNIKEEWITHLFEDTIENEEWELFVLYSMLHYMCGFYEPWKKNHWFWTPFNKRECTIPLDWITPKWWNYRKTYIYLFYLFKNLNIQGVDVSFSREEVEEFCEFFSKTSIKSKIESIDFKTDNFLLHKFINEWETTLFFEEPLFLYIDQRLLEWCEIKNTFDSEENVEKILKLLDKKLEYFVLWVLEKKYWTLPFNKQKELLLDKFSKYHNFFWRSFNLSESYLDGKWEDISSFTFIHFIVFLLRFKYITISEFLATEEKPIMDNDWNYVRESELYSFRVYIKPKLENIIIWWVKLKGLILDKIFSDEYKQITIKKKKNWELSLLEWKLEFIWDDKKQVELKKKYPHSNVTSINYGWKTTKYKITDKIKLDINLK